MDMNIPGPVTMTMACGNYAACVCRRDYRIIRVVLNTGMLPSLHSRYRVESTVLPRLIGRTRR